MANDAIDFNVIDAHIRESGEAWVFNDEKMYVEVGETLGDYRVFKLFNTRPYDWEEMDADLYGYQRDMDLAFWEILGAEDAYARLEQWRSRFQG